MEASLRRTSNSSFKNKKYHESILPLIPRQERETKMNMQRREKLANSLTDKFVKKFNSPSNRGLINREVSDFLKRERLNEQDLRKFETELHKKITTKLNKETLKENLKTNLKSKNQNSTKDLSKQTNKKIKIENSEQNENQQKNILNDSRMSGASDLDKFDEKCANDRVREQETLNFKKISQLT